jgi:hypothetical protein
MKYDMKYDIMEAEGMQGNCWYAFNKYRESASGTLLHSRMRPQRRSIFARAAWQGRSNRIEPFQLQVTSIWMYSYDFN